MKNLCLRYIIDVANTALMRRTKQVLILRSHLADNIHCQYFPKTRIFSGISAPPPLCLSTSFWKWKIRPELDPNPKSLAFWPFLLLHFFSIILFLEFFGIMIDLGSGVCICVYKKVFTYEYISVILHFYISAPTLQAFCLNSEIQPEQRGRRRA